MQFNSVTGYRTLLAGSGVMWPNRNGQRGDTVITRDADGQGTSAAFGGTGIVDMTFNAYTREIFGSTSFYSGWWTGGRLFALRTVCLPPLHT